MHLYRWHILKYGCYLLLAMLLFHLQSAPGLLEIGGVSPMPLAALAVLAAIFESELPGTLFSLFCGYLCDLYGQAPMGYYMLLLAACGLLLRVVIRTYLRASWHICTAAVLLTVLLCRLLVLLFWFPMSGLAGGGHVFFAYDLPHVIYTALWAVPLFFLVRMLHRMADDHSAVQF